MLIWTYNYRSAKLLGKLLDDNILNNYSAKNTFSFVEELKTVTVTSKYMVSCDVTSWFTNIPLEETIHLTVDHLFEGKPDLKITRKNLEKLFHFTASQTNIIFKGNIYDQIDGAPVGSSLTPILMNIFMGYHEKGWTRDCNYGGLLYYKRYADNIFAVFETKYHAI